MAAQTIKKLLKTLQNDLKSAWKSVERLRTLLDSPKLRKTSKTRWFFIVLGVSRVRQKLQTWDERGNGKHIHDIALACVLMLL